VGRIPDVQEYQNQEHLVLGAVIEAARMPQLEIKIKIHCASIIASALESAKHPGTVTLLHHQNLFYQENK
jgi:hypothetical protein